MKCVTASLIIVCSGSVLAQDRVAGPVFENGEAQVVPAFRDHWIQEDLWVETEFDSDGDGRLDRMHVDVTRPRQTEGGALRVPVIYETSPYYSGTGSTEPRYFWDPHQKLGSTPSPPPTPPPIDYAKGEHQISGSLCRAWVPRGFAVVHSNSPGTGRSQGCPTVGGENEALAPKAVIDWLCGRAAGFTTPGGDERVLADWCSGKVGMTGTSYNGTLCIAAATTGVPGLEAIIPVSPNTSYYNYYRANGLVRHPGGYMGEDVDILYEFIHSGDPAMRAHCDHDVRDELLRARQDRASGDWNDFWAGRDYVAKLGGLRCAVFLAHGLNDWNVMPSHSIRVYEELARRGMPVHLYLHQGGHGGPPPFAMMNRWFSHFLYGVENGVEKEAPVWIVREEESRENPTPYPAYPCPLSQPVVLHPTPGGRGRGGLGLTSAAQGVVEVFNDDFEKNGKELASAKRSPHRLLYLSKILRRDLHLSGTPSVTLRLAADRPAANLSIWLLLMPGGSRAGDPIIVTRGWADPQNADSLRESRPLVPGEFVDLTFELEPDDQILPEGSRLAWMIFSSDRDFTLWPPPGTELRLDLAHTSLTLPLVGGSEAWVRATR